MCIPTKCDSVFIAYVELQKAAGVLYLQYDSDVCTKEKQGILLA